MKKIIAMMLVVIMCIGLVACTDTGVKDTQEKKVEGKATETVTTEKEDEKKEDEAVAVETKEETSEEEEEEIAVLDIGGLSGMELLAAISVNIPDTVISTTESVAADGTMSSSKMYKKGDNTRTETDSPDMGEQVMIYNAELGEMYVYSVAEKSGLISKDDEDDMEENTERDLEGEFSYADLMEGEDLTNFEAKIEELNGEQVIYIHTSSEDEGMAMDIHTWYAISYMVAMKTEMYINGKLAGSSELTDVQVNVDIDDSMFEKPEGITFMDMPF